MDIDSVCEECLFGSVEDGIEWAGELHYCQPVYCDNRLEVQFMIEYLRGALIQGRIDAALGTLYGLTRDGYSPSAANYRVAQGLPFRGPCEPAPEQS